jgi:hypothetical protein
LSGAVSDVAVEVGEVVVIEVVVMSGDGITLVAVVVEEESGTVMALEVESLAVEREAAEVVSVGVVVDVAVSIDGVGRLVTPEVAMSCAKTGVDKILNKNEVGDDVVSCGAGLGATGGVDEELVASLDAGGVVSIGDGVAGVVVVSLVVALVGVLFEVSGFIEAVLLVVFELSVEEFESVVVDCVVEAPEEELVGVETSEEEGVIVGTETSGGVPRNIESLIVALCGSAPEGAVPANPLHVASPAVAATSNEAELRCEKPLPFSGISCTPSSPAMFCQAPEQFAG